MQVDFAFNAHITSQLFLAQDSSLIWLKIFLKQFVAEKLDP